MAKRRRWGLGTNHGISGIVMDNIYICERCGEEYEIHSLKRRKYCHSCSIAVDRDRAYGQGKERDKGIGYPMYALEYTLEGQYTADIGERARSIINKIKGYHFVKEHKRTRTNRAARDNSDHRRDDCTVDLTEPRWRED